MTSSAVAVVVEALEGVDVARVSAAGCSNLLLDVRRVRGWLDAFEARVTTRVDELASAGSGASSVDLHTRCSGDSASDGLKKQRRAEVLGDAPSFESALSDGRISASHVDALANAAANTTDDVKASLFDAQDELAEQAGSMRPDEFKRHLQATVRGLERSNGLERNQRQRNGTFIMRRLNMATGMIEGTFALHPELGNQVFRAIDAEVAAMIATGEKARDPEFVDRTVSRNRLAAEALGRLILGGQGLSRPLEADITVIIDARTLETGKFHDRSVSETGDGLELPPASVLRLLCQGLVTPVIKDRNGNVLFVGRTVRNANRAQRRALRVMYRTCAFDGCEVPFHRCEIHHIVPWERGGPTDLDNLIPLCSRHHHQVHDLAWKLRLEPDRTLVITQPDGTEYTRTRPYLAPYQARAGTDPPPPTPPAAPPGAGPPDPGSPPSTVSSNTGPPDPGRPASTATSNTDPPDPGSPPSAATSNTGTPDPGKPPGTATSNTDPPAMGPPDMGLPDTRAPLSGPPDIEEPPEPGRRTPAA